MRSRLLLACGLLLVAFAARTYRLFESSTWGDDVWSMAAATGHSLDVRLDGMAKDENYSDPPGLVTPPYFLKYIQPRPGNSVWGVIRDAYAQESHPPLFFTLLHLWFRLVGASLEAGRAFSLIFSLATIPLLFFLTRRLAGETAAWIACLLYAMSPFQAQLAIQVRGYTLTGLLVLATIWLTFEMLEREPSPKQVSSLIVLGITGMLMHYYFAIYSFLEGLALLTQRRLLRTAVVVGVVWTAVLGALTFYFLNSPSSQAQPWINHNPWEASLLFLNASAAMTDLLVLSPNESLIALMPSHPLLILAIKSLLVATVGVLLMVAARRLPNRYAVFLLVWLWGPVLLIFTIDIARNSATVLTARYFAGSAFAFYVLLAAGLAYLKPLARAAGTTFLVAIMLAGQCALRVLPMGVLADGFDAQRAAAQISGAWQPQDLVIVVGNYGCVPISLAYYLPPQTPMLPLIYLPRTETGLVVAPATLDNVWPRLDRIAATPHIWLVTSFSDQALTGKVDYWINAHYRSWTEPHRYGGIAVKGMTLKDHP
jgi:hypothetical protein